MSPKSYKTKKIERSDFIIYLNKAKEFYRTMYRAEKAEDWNAAGLNGVHCVISLIDALLCKYEGIRSSEEEHMKVIDLLNSSLSGKYNFKDISQRSQTAKRVIAKKNLIEYENRNFLQSEALGMIKHVQRFYEWATENLQRNS